ncbi:asparagine--tRNA ligase [Fenollaria sporofastidiosus]|uniref:asparagine--tRNA ligase n=1 Tax=Fenollaria sporofastidiosus TaxID=2811778 RepID=UPI001C005211|nr:asparagine--tRNA ligase [Fenollaria sporofastidiosus]
MDIRELYKSYKELDGKTVEIQAWIRNLRAQKEFGFIEINDGSFFNSVQVVYDNSLENFERVSKLYLSASIRVKGKVVLTPNNKQAFEIKAEEIEVLGDSTADYPLQNKRHSMEFLRSIAHLRPRANLFRAAYRIRSLAAFAIHKFFNEQDFIYVHTPILTASDAEGAGEMFQVTTLDIDNPPRTEEGAVDYSKDFFDKPTHLTVSGQLEGETFALAFSKIYTFGPTFRAENSNTTRHAAEFWMIEPEMAFMDNNQNMDVAEAMLKYVINYVMENAKEELEFCNNFVDKGLIDRLNHVRSSDFERVTYTRAIDILKEHEEKFDVKVEWGMDLQTEHERFLTEQVFKKPIFVTDYPKDIKAFYMKLNPDNKTVAAMDCLVPGIGEIVGGSQREEDYTKLEKRINEMGLDMDSYTWYMDLRKYGSVVHSGYGLGFERLIMYITGIENIRDVLPFPRTVHHCEF